MDKVTEKLRNKTFLKKDVEINSEKLINLIKPFFIAFNSGDDDVIVRKQVTENADYVEEKFELSERNYLTSVEIQRDWYFDQDDTCEECLKIVVKWFDWDDIISYSSEYYTDLDNDVVLRKTKVLLKAAENLAMIAHKAHQKKIKQ